MRYQNRQFRHEISVAAPPSRGRRCEAAAERSHGQNPNLFAEYSDLVSVTMPPAVLGLDAARRLRV